MQFSDHRLLRADPATVWAALFDTEVLRSCIPGCETLTGTVEDGYEALVIQRIGPIKVQFLANFALSDITPGRALTLTGEGKGGAAGFASGGARVSLTEQPEGTRLDYTVEAAVGGRLAQLGGRIIDGFAGKLAEGFFRRFQSAVDGPADPQSDPPPKPGWLTRLTGG